MKTLHKKILQLFSVQGLGPKKVVRILEKNENLKEIEKDAFFLQQIGIEKSKFQDWKSPQIEEQVEQELEEVNKRDIQLVCFKEQQYPTLLKEIYGFPPLLSYYGKIPDDNHFFVAFVGSRRASNYGLKHTKRILTELAKDCPSLVVVSGLAYGIDSIAHKTALELGIKTIAVLGSGLGCIYPKAHIPLAEEIIKNDGAVFSEFRTLTTPSPNNFPFRNRIISGLSSATVVMEAALKSGALITARMALEQNREVFALVGNVDSFSYQGCNQLVQQGANLLTKGIDILENFSLQKNIPLLEPELQTKKEKIQSLENEKEKIILEHLKQKPSTIEELAEDLEMPISNVMQLVTTLELQEKLREELGGKYYFITPVLH